jgi:acetyl-CoA carboxylase biotin carboxyl carrier protein
MKSLPFDAAAVRALAGILAETGLTEIEVESKDGRIRVARTPAPVAATVAPAVMAADATATGQAPEPPPLAEPDYAHHPGAVLSPMVGIIYLTPEPGAPPFVTVGAAVASGQTLLLIEAMKTFNQIKATKAGTVTRVLVASGTPVEYGQPLLIVE